MIIEKCYFQRPKDTSVHKYWRQATGRPVDNLPSKIEVFENFRTAIPRNKRNMFIAIILSFFIAYFADFS